MTRSLSFPFIFTLFIAGFHLSATKICVPKYDNVEIEFVLTQDATHSYTEFIGKLKTTVLPDLVRIIDEQYPGSRFGLTTFGDWFNRTKDVRDACYTFYSPLTTDREKYISDIQNITMMNGADGREASLLGMSLSVTDPKMGWSKKNKTEGGTRVVKVLAIATDNPSLMPHEKTDGTVFRGDSSDSCDRRAPEIEDVGKVLRHNDVFVLGLISGRTEKVLLENIHTYEGYLREMGVQGLVKPLELLKPEQLITAVTKGIREIICIQETTTATTTTTIATVNIAPTDCI